jgi:hypothetical protein
MPENLSPDFSKGSSATMIAYASFPMIKIDAPRVVMPESTSPDGKGWCTDDDPTPAQLQALAINGRADQYEKQIKAALDLMKGSRVGGFVLNALPTNKTITIQPKIAAAAKKPTQAIPWKGQEKKAYARGVHLFGGQTLTPDQYGPNDLVGEGDGVKGSGSDVLIPFDSDQSVPACMDAPGNKPRIGDDDDMVLVHELIHALREMDGALNPIPFNRMPCQMYVDEEEFYAILVQNIYISERCGFGAKLIMDHEQHKPLSEAKILLERIAGFPTFDWATSVGFLKGNKDNLRLVARFCNQEEPDLSHQIEGVDVPFNPVREYRMNKAKYPV